MLRPRHESPRESPKVDPRAEPPAVTRDPMTRDRVARMAGSGMSPEEIAEEFGVSPHHVRFMLGAYRV